MINDELLNGVYDIVKGVLGVKSQNANIMLTTDGKIVFCYDRSCIYIVQTDMFTLPMDEFVANHTINETDLSLAYNICNGIYIPIYTGNDLQDDEEFVRLCNLKSKDGIEYYNIYINGNILKIPMFTGFIKFNKNDKCSLEIYDVGPFWLNKFIVIKKKINYPIYVYFLTMKLS